MWWFSSVDPTQPEHSGRFDLPTPNGTCYLAATDDVAILEALQEDYQGGMLPMSALEARHISSTAMPPDTPAAANLSDRRALGAGVTAALWAGSDRLLTQHWAVEVHGSGWQAMWHGCQHDPTGAGRSVTLFDRAGQHEPWGVTDLPEVTTDSLASEDTVDFLEAHGISVTRGKPDLEMLDESP